MELWVRVTKGCLLQAIPHGMVNPRTLLGGSRFGSAGRGPQGISPGVIQGGARGSLLVKRSPQVASASRLIICVASVRSAGPRLVEPPPKRASVALSQVLFVGYFALSFF